MRKSKILSMLRSYPWRKHNVEYVILFGSAVYSSSPRDIDIAVKFGNYSFEKYLSILEGVSSYLKVAEDKIDIIPLDSEDLPAQLILEIYCKGVLLYCADFNRFLNEALRRINISYDFLLTCRKVKCFEALLREVKKSWES